MSRVKQDVSLGGKVQTPKKPKTTFNTGNPAAQSIPSVNSISFGTNRMQEALQDENKFQTELGAAKEQMRKGKKQFESGVLETPVAAFLENPSETIKEDLATLGKNAKNIVDYITQKKDSLEISNNPREDKRLNNIIQGQKNMAHGTLKGIKAGVDRMKKKLKRIFNHPEWYGKYPEFLTTNLNYGVRKEAGKFLMGVGAKVAVTLVTPQKNGVVSQAYKDAVNALFVKLRGGNTGAFNYSPEDIAAYVEYTRGIRGLHANLVRDLKLINNVDAYISQTPDALLSVAGYDATGIADMKANRSLYMNELNQMANAITATMQVFPDQSLLDRTLFVARAMIEEGKGPKSSVYVYTIDTVIGWDSTNKLKSVSVAGNSFSYRLSQLRKLIADFNSYTNPTYGPNTFVKIAGDLLKAYGDKAFRQVELVDLTMKADVVFDEYLLHQIQNMNPIADSDPFSLTTVPADIYSLIYTSQFNVPGDATHTYNTKEVYGIIDSTGDSEPLIINTDKSMVSGLETISLTRSVSMFKADVATANYGSNVAIQLWESGSDILSIAAYYYTPNTQAINRYGMITRGKSVMPAEELSLWAQIDYMPAIQIFEDGNDNSLFKILLDLDTYADLTKEQLQVLNDTATLSLLKTVEIQSQVNYKAAKR